MNKRQSLEYNQRQTLNHAEWDVNKEDTISMNTGSETLKHILAKTLLAKALKEENWRIDTEVEMPGGVVDLLAYGREGRQPIVIEVETSPTEETIQDKVNRYVRGQPVRDLFVANPGEMPTDMHEALSWARDEVGVVNE